MNVQVQAGSSSMRARYYEARERVRTPRKRQRPSQYYVGTIAFVGLTALLVVFTVLERKRNKNITPDSGGGANSNFRTKSPKSLRP